MKRESWFASRESQQRTEEEMKYPILKGRQNTLPSKAKCPVCRKHKVLEPHTMVILSGDAMKRIDKDAYSGGNHADLVGTLNLAWHGAHDSGEGTDRETGFLIPIVEHVKGGMFDLNFCSPKCLRIFLNTIVDDFEKQLQKERKRRPTTRVRHEMAAILADERLLQRMNRGSRDARNRKGRFVE
ncbi:MAG: hypothetical protein V1809_16380 [Planctomycetota bacterium]